MDKLVLKRRKSVAMAKDPSIYYRVRCSMESYNKVVEVADETGENIRQTVDRMLAFAFDNIIYESEEK